MDKIIKIFHILFLLSIILITVSCEEKIEKKPDPNSQLRIDAMIEIKGKEKELLTTYGVVDKKTEIYRVPISRAMELIAQESE